MPDLQKDGTPFCTPASANPEYCRQTYEYCCTLTAEPDTRNVYLGRPWRPYANVLFEACKIGGHVHPTGWDNWDDKKNEQTVKFSERNNNYETSIKRPEWIHLEKQGVQK